MFFLLKETFFLVFLLFFSIFHNHAICGPTAERNKKEGFSETTLPCTPQLIIVLLF